MKHTHSKIFLSILSVFLSFCSGKSGMEDNEVNPIILYSTTKMYDGDFKHHDPSNTSARAGADKICENNRPTSISTTEFPEIRAFVTIGSDSAIADFPKLYNVNKSAQIKSPQGVSIAKHWKDLLNGNIEKSLDALNIVLVEDFYWTGSTLNGYSSGANCNNFTSNASMTIGTIGRKIYTDERWLNFSQSVCSQKKQLLCVAFKS